MKQTTMNFAMSAAELSADGRHRWWLIRQWSHGELLPFIGLNPSTADAMQDDPTIRRCKAFARREGFAGIIMLNLFGRRATDPKELLALPRRLAIGRENDEAIRRQTRSASVVVCCWGVGGRLHDRDREVTECLLARRPGPPRLVTFGYASAGDPRHPLYVKADAPLIDFKCR